MKVPAELRQLWHCLVLMSRRQVHCLSTMMSDMAKDDEQMCAMKVVCGYGTHIFIVMPCTRKEHDSL